MRPSALLLLLPAAFTIAAFAQTPVIPHAGEAIDVSIVNVDTVVTDKQGNRAHGLRKEDFEIFENGVRQPITNFAEYASARETTHAVDTAGQSSIAALPPPPQPRTIIVFVERFELPSFRSDPIFGAMKKLLHNTVRPGDRVMVVSWNRGILGIRQDFTDDLVRIDRAIDDIAQRTSTVLHDVIADMTEEVDRIRTFEAEAASMNAGRIGVPEVPSESGLSFFVESAVHQTAKDALLDEKRKVHTINALMRSAAGLDGKKIMLLATHRLSMYAGGEAMFAAGPETLPSDFKMEFDAKPLIRSLIETANANGFTIYPIYAEGLATTAGAGAYRDLNNETPMLEYVASETGGAAAWGSSDVTKLLPSIADDFDSYYSLAYRATGGKPAARRIEVRVKDPKLSARERKQYVPKSDTTRMDDRVIATLFGNAMPSSFDVAVRSATPKLDEKKHYVIPITVEVPIASLTTLPGAGNVHNGAFTVYMAWRAILGGVSETHRDTKQFSIADADMAKAKAGHYTYEIGVESSTPNLRIALGVYDEVSKEYALKLVDLRSPTTGR
jgi:VWFA-related protein